ncbi:DUF6493 family protein [Actinoplanes sp. NPDC023714]|uniref:DUF6493 family protein n=1 Tax=Actinoplanes sp. NPDC023714 TaxID=3154322 RepID=UPI0033C4E0AD
MSLTWQEIHALARRNDRPGMVRLLRSATPAERAAAFPVVAAAVKAMTREPEMGARTIYAMAVVGTAPTAAKAVPVLRRPSLAAWNWQAGDVFLALAAALELAWIGELGYRLAERLPARDPWPDDWFFAAALMRGGGVTPPIAEGVVRGWVRSLVRPWRPGRPVPPLVQRLRDDPWRDVLLPAVFEIDAIGAEFGAADGLGGRPRLPEAVAALVGEGILERKTILAAVVDRLLRGGRPHALRGFVLLHDALAPTVDELSTHALDYARLLATGSGPVAALAQRGLRAVDDAGRLERDTLLRAAAETLLRTEKTLVRAQLTWLDRVVRRDPSRGAEVLVAVAGAFGHGALDVQERALDLVSKHRSLLDASAAEAVAAAASSLGDDLPGRAARLFGGGPVADSPADSAADSPADSLADSPVASPADFSAAAPGREGGVGMPAPVAEMPGPIADAAELAGEVAGLIHEQSAVGWERVLAGLVALYAAGEREALAAMLLPVVDRHAGWFEPNRWNAGSPFVGLGLAIRVATEPGGGAERALQDLAIAVRIAWQEGRRGLPGSSFSTRPDGVLALRAAEVAVHLVGTMVPMTVATPTHVNGSIDAEVLLARLSRAEAEGWQPWPFDFEQALLRIPRDAGDLVTARAAKLTSPAGRQFAQWLAGGGLPDPISEPVVQPGERGRDGGRTRDAPVPRRVVASLRPARDGGLRLERQLLTLTPAKHAVSTPGDFDGIEDILAMVLPHHREVAAAWALGDIASLADQNRRGAGRLLPLLADCTGPVGPAMAYALAYAFAAKHEPDRAAAADAFLTLAAGRGAGSGSAAGLDAGSGSVAGFDPGSGSAGGLDAGSGSAAGLDAGAGFGPPARSGEGAGFASLVGAALADLASDGTIKMTRVLPALADMHRAGASVAVWELLTAALPPLLPTTARTVPDLLELAGQVAVGLRLKGDLVPGLAEIAGRGGTTRVVKEAKRLLSILSA